MISIQSLSENLLPNLYLKKATLNTKYTTVVSNPKSDGYGTPDNAQQINELKSDENYSASTLSLSMKFLKNSNLETEIMKLFDSGLAQLIDVYVHQVEDPNTFQNILSNPSKLTLTTIDPAPGITTRKTSFSEVSSWTNLFYLNQNVGVQQSSVRLPEQTLEDGTSLYEVLFDFNFQFPKDALFLGYIFVTAIRNTAPGIDDIDEVFISKPSSEIVVLNGEVQNTGMLFTIAPYPANATPGEIKQLNSFGKPGDVWAGGVHYHEPSERFMAGTEHNPKKPHPFLDYSVVPVRKIVDNRIKDKVEKNIINVTKAFETLNSGFTKYKNSANYLDFNQYKTNTFVSDIYLSQNSSGDVNGAFTVDKLQLLREKSAFKFLFDKIKVMLANQQNILIYKNSVNLLLNSSKLERLSLFETLAANTKNAKESQLCTINSDSADVEKFTTKNDYKGKESKNPADTEVVFMKNNFSIYGDSNTSSNDLGVEQFSFKRVFKENNPGEIEYGILVEYSDPTVNIVKDILTKLQEATTTLEFILNGNPENIELSVTSEKVLSSVDSLAEDAGLAMFFYNPNYSYGEFKKYLKTLGTYNSFDYKNDAIKREETKQNFFILVQFLTNLRKTLTTALANVGSKPLNTLDGTGESNSYGTAQSKMSSRSAPIEPNISYKSKKSKIKIYNYGYDFTGYLKRSDRGGVSQSTIDTIGNSLVGRDNSEFLTISLNDYRTLCRYLFAQLTPNDLDPTVGLEESFDALGIGTNTPNDAAYSYLNIPTAFAKDCVDLPATVLDKKVLFDSSKFSTEIALQLLFYNIIKFKKEVFENHLTGLNNKGISPSVYLQEEINSVLTDFGFRVPSLVDVDYSKDIPPVPSDEGEKSSSTKEDDIGIESPISPAINPHNIGIGAANDASNFFFSVQTDTPQQSNIPKTNFFLGSMLDRKLFKSFDSFRLTTTDNDFTPWSGFGFLGYIFYHFPNANISSFSNVQLNGGAIPPLQVLSLSLNTSVSNPFRDFLTGNENYIRNGVINPFLLSLFWFKHQNIVRVEYLAGYENSTDTISIKNEDGTLYTTENGSISVDVETRNVNKPIWKVLNKQALDNMKENTKILCRLSRYNYSYYINKRLIKELNLPLLNNYFILERPIRNLR